MGKRFLLGFVMLLPMLAAFLIPMTVVHAAAFTVTTTTDEKDDNLGDGICHASAANACTLRAAIQQANANRGSSTITLPAGQYVLNATDSGNLNIGSHDLEIANAITIVGAGQGSTLIVGSGDRVFDIENYFFPSASKLAVLTISGVTIAGGSRSLGGGVYVGNSVGGSAGATFNATDVSMKANVALADGSGPGYGGAIFNYGDGSTGGSVSLTRCTLDQNTAVQGGAIVNAYPATMTITGSTISNNQATGQFAGAIRNTGTLTFNGGAVTGNKAGTRTAAPTTLGGGAIYNGDPPDPSTQQSTLNVTGTAFLNNEVSLGQVSNGGAIWNETGGAVTLTRATLSGNLAYEGGAILNDQGLLTLIESTVQGNTAFFGGGVYNNTVAPLSTPRTFMTAYRTTFSGNVATNVGCPDAIIQAGGLCGAGGAIFSENSTTNVNDSTLSGNTAAVQGGGIYNLRINNGTTANAIVSLTNTTVAGNAAGPAGPGGRPNGAGGVWDNQGTYVFKNTIIAINTAGDCFAMPGSVMTSNGNNLDSDNSCAFGQASDKHGNPNLGSLTNYGGATETLALLAGSPAIDAGDNAACASAAILNVDQRGIARPQGAACDIGAYEYVPPPPGPSPLPAQAPQGNPAGSPPAVLPVGRAAGQGTNTAPAPLPTPR